jgi:hypothetical protein
MRRTFFFGFKGGAGNFHNRTLVDVTIEDVIFKASLTTQNFRERNSTKEKEKKEAFGLFLSFFEASLLTFIWSHL